MRLLSVSAMTSSTPDGMSSMPRGAFSSDVAAGRPSPPKRGPPVPAGGVQRGGGGGRPAPPEGGPACAGESRDEAVLVDVANAVASLLGDEEAAGRGHRHVDRDVQLGCGGRSAVAARPATAITGHGRDGAVRRDAAD